MVAIVPVLTLSIIMLRYLSLKKGGPSESWGDSETSDSAKHQQRFFLERAVDSMRKDIAELSQHAGQQVQMTEADKSRLFAVIEEQIRTDLSESFLETVEKKYAPTMLTQARAEQLIGRCSNTRSRLSDEIYSLTRRGNLNLVIGSLTAIIGLALLGYFVVASGTEFAALLKTSSSDQTPAVDARSITPLLGLFLPRLSLVVVIEVFAYFFLKLYRKSLEEIKYFQNEMTNIEAQFISLEGALFLEDKEPLRQIIEQLSKTERNFVLSKGETTVEIEKLKLEGHGMADALSTITTLAEQVKKSP